MNSNYSLNLEDSTSFVLRISTKPVFNSEFENFGRAWYDYICSTLLSDRVRQRLGITVAEQVLDFVRDRRVTYESIANTTRLIHCDYNPKNIIMSRIDLHWKVAAILDWRTIGEKSPNSWISRQ